MRCETCRGTGYSCGPNCAAKLFSDHLPCLDCNGSGISHCCDGLRAPVPPDGPCLGPIDEETRRRIDEYNREQRDPGDETAEFHENPIIDALLTEASDAAIGAIIGGEITEWPDELGQMECEVTGCADDCCHPDHGHMAEFKFSEDVRATLAVGEIKPYAVGVDWRELSEAFWPVRDFVGPASNRPNTMVLRPAGQPYFKLTERERALINSSAWRETLEKAREFNALPDTHDEWRSLNDE